MFEGIARQFSCIYLFDLEKKSYSITSYRWILWLWWKSLYFLDMMMHHSACLDFLE